MPKINGNIRGFILGILAAVVVMMLMGAVNHQTQNIGGDAIHSFQSVYASSDGKISRIRVKEGDNVKKGDFCRKISYCNLIK